MALCGSGFFGARNFFADWFHTGFFLAWFFYRDEAVRAAKVLARAAGLHRLLAAKYYVDELYEAVLGQPLTWLSDAVFLKFGDRTLLDGSLNGMAKIAHLTAGVLSRVQTGNLHRYVFWVLAGSAACLLWSLRRG